MYNQSPQRKQDSKRQMFQIVRLFLMVGYFFYFLWSQSDIGTAWAQLLCVQTQYGL